MTAPGNSHLGVPLDIAELVYVALNHTIEAYQGRLPADYVANMQKILQTYDRGRTYSLMQRAGVPPPAIRKYSEVAAERLITWLLKQGQQFQGNDEDFEQWTEELLGDDPT